MLIDMAKPDIRVGIRYGSDRAVMQFPSRSDIPSELRTYAARAIMESRKRDGKLGQSYVDGKTLYAWDEKKQGHEPYYVALGILSESTEAHKQPVSF